MSEDNCDNGFTDDAAPDQELVSGSPDTIDAISDHITLHIGEIAFVFHEIVSPLVHIDVHVVGPTPQRDYYTLVTSGMSDRPMSTPDSAHDFCYAELMLSLPPTWLLSKEAFKDECNYWPIRLLKTAARFPHEHNTWITVGHTMIEEGEPTSYAENTAMCSMIVGIPMNVPEEFWRLDRPSGDTVFFYSVIPIHIEELNYKLKHGSDALFDRLLKRGVSEILDPQRKSVIRKRLFGLF